MLCNVVFVLLMYKFVRIWSNCALIHTSPGSNSLQQQRLKHCERHVLPISTCHQKRAKTGQQITPFPRQVTICLPTPPPSFQREGRGSVKAYPQIPVSYGTTPALGARP